MNLVSVPLRTPASVSLFGILAALIYYAPRCDAFIPLAISAFCWFLLAGPLSWWRIQWDIAETTIIILLLLAGTASGFYGIYVASQSCL